MKDVTKLVAFGFNDDEYLPLTKCVCGKAFDLWDFVLGIYKDEPTECPACKRGLYFDVFIRVFQVEQERG